jgi:hypothetical protein
MLQAVFLVLRLQLRNQAVVRKPQQGKAGESMAACFLEKLKQLNHVETF